MGLFAKCFSKVSRMFPDGLSANGSIIFPSSSSKTNLGMEFTLKCWVKSDSHAFWANHWSPSIFFDFTIFFQGSSESSIDTVKNATGLPSNSFFNLSQWGCSAMHGPHQVAQISM